MPVLDEVDLSDDDDLMDSQFGRLTADDEGSEPARADVRGVVVIHVSALGDVAAVGASLDAVIARGAKAEAALRAAGYEVLWLPTNGGSRTEIVEVTGRRPAAGHWR